MALLIHRSDHPDLLVDALCDVIAPPLDDPFTAEIIAVPTRGIDRWLTQRIASTLADRGIGDGIAANIEFPFPHGFVTDVLSQLPDTARSIDAWSTRSVVSHLERIIDDHHDDDWMWLIARFVEGPDGDASDGAQRLRAAQKIGRLFSSYARYRPRMVSAWTAGDDVGPDGGPIAEAAAWQPRLWRLLYDQIGVPPLAETLPGALASLRSGTAGVGLPERISIYGVTAFDPVDVAVFEAIGDATDMHLFLLHPSPSLWHDTAPFAAAMPESSEPVRRSDDPARSIARHPLLRSWAQESRELQIVLGNRGASAEDTRVSGDVDAGTLLAALQGDIRSNREPTKMMSDRSDRSIQIHACHGAQRQVEVLRDALLHLLANDSTLEPRDIVIMTPDLETYAPLIEAAFPASSGRDRTLPDLRVRIADRAPTRTNPLIGFAGTVVDLAASRLGTGTVTQLLGLAEVQRRFGIGADTASDVAGLIDDANVRWGLDGDHRERNGAGARDEHTWRRGIDRILTGVFFDDDPIRTVGDVAPLTHVEGQVSDAGGRLALLIERLAVITELLSTPEPTSRWAEKISISVRLLAEPPWGDEWQWGQLERLLEETFPPEIAGTPNPVIGLDEATVLIAPWTEDRPGRLHHRTGDVTVCTLAPMRSVPYRVVCLLGMEHDRFPRSSRNDGDDLLIDDEAVGDRDRSAEDRQLLLDALMAAADHLVITYTGRDPLTNAEYPPAVPVAELEETVGAMIGDAAAAMIRTDHPLQPFSPKVFTSGELGVSGPWGFDPIQYAGAVALAGREPDDGVAGDLVLESVIIEAPTLHRLISYLKAPSKTFLRNSLGMFIPDMGDLPDDELPTGLNGLGKWSVADRLLTGIRHGYDAERLIGHERAADTVPAGELATGSLGEALDLAQRIQKVAGDRGCVPGAAVPVTGTVTIGGEAITGSVLADPDAAVICDVGPSRGKPGRRIALYTQVVFLTALDPDRAWHGIMVGKGDKETVLIVTIGPLGDSPGERSAEAERRLSELVSLYREGMAAPLPIFTETSFVWMAAEPRKRTSETAKKWEPDWKGEGGEREEPAHRMLFDGLATVADLASSEFSQYADRLWAPILEVSSEENA
ncbi:MAG: exodeoxyribonuclease V subunit gamma [Actinomycetota bacterium]|nr:exodeoxyribonuclease V subunit gamma [Actinomycetota bacterium]